MPSFNLLSEEIHLNLVITIRHSGKTLNGLCQFSNAAHLKVEFLIRFFFRLEALEKKAHQPRFRKTRFLSFLLQHFCFISAKPYLLLNTSLHSFLHIIINIKYNFLLSSAVYLSRTLWLSGVLGSSLKSPFLPAGVKRDCLLQHDSDTYLCSCACSLSAFRSNFTTFIPSGVL